MPRSLDLLMVGRGWPAIGIDDEAVAKRVHSPLGFQTRRRVMPKAVSGNKRVGLFWSPSATPVGDASMVVLQNWIDDRPSGLDRVFASKQGAVPLHCITQKPLIG